MAPIIYYDLMQIPYLPKLVYLNPFLLENNLVQNFCSADARNMTNLYRNHLLMATATTATATPALQFYPGRFYAESLPSNRS